MLSPISGGTDVCSAFVGGNPLTPVWEGEIPCRYLGCAVAAFDEDGRSVVGEQGELVITEPMPSMPVGFWGDADGSRYRAAYFEHFPGVWRHGDWVTLTERGSCLITGRSDATLNRGGVRVGTAEIYRVAEAVEGVVDSLVVHLEAADATEPGTLLLFVVLDGGEQLDDAATRRIRDAIRARPVTAPRSRRSGASDVDPDDVERQEARAAGEEDPARRRPGRRRQPRRVEGSSGAGRDRRTRNSASLRRDHWCVAPLAA